MEENKRHIDDFLRDELGDYTETPPPAAWDDLEKRLDAPQSRKGFDFRKWWWFIPALLFVAGGTFLAAHKWGAPARIKQQAPVIDTAVENTYAPANVYTDTAKKHTDTNTAQPIKQKTDSPAHVQAKAPAKTAAQKTQAIPATDHVKNTGKTASSGNTATPTTTIAGNTATDQKQRPAAKVKSQATAKQDQASIAHKDIPATEAATQDNIIAKPAQKTKKHKQPVAQTNLAATAKNTNNTVAHKDIPATEAATQDNIIAKPAQKTKKHKQPVAQTNLAVTAKNSNNTVAQKDIPATEAATQDNIIVKPTQKTKKNKQTVAKTTTPVKQKIVATPAVAQTKDQLATTSHAAKPANRKPVKPAKQAAPAITKSNTPAMNREPKPARTTERTVTAKTHKTPKQLPVAQQKSINEQPPRQQLNTPVTPSPVQEKTNDQSYTFNSKSKTNTTGKPKSNLDLSDKQAAAEADTAEEREMDPYASLNPPQDKHRPKLEGGIKAAYTYGFSDFALNKFTALPYIQLNLSNKLSVALHLGFSYGQMKKTDLTGSQSYYKINNTDFTKSQDSSGGQLDTFYTYHYTQSRDSFSVKYTTAKSLWEIELPVILKYNLTSSLSLFGGPVFTFGKIIQITENKSATYSSDIVDSLVHTKNVYNVDHFNNLHPPSGSPDSTRNSTPYQNATSTPVRIGYMVGISYNAGQRIVVDLSLQQMLSGAGFIPNETLRKVYTQPYMRLAVGFRIFK